MIDVPNHAIVVERRASDDRFLLFTNTDLPPGSLLPWASVMADTYGDGTAFFARLDEVAGPEGFTLLDLLDIATLRAIEEVARQPTVLADRVEAAICHARAEELDRRAGLRRHSDRGTGLVEPTPELPYRLAAVWAGSCRVELCRTPTGQAEGVTLEQLLIVAEQVCIDAANRLSSERRLPRTRQHLGEAIRCEGHRVGMSRNTSS